MNNYTPYIDILRKAETIAVFMHINPDGDCIGSALSLYRFLQKCGKDVSVFSPNFNIADIPRKLSFLPYIGDINAHARKKEYDLCVGVDLGDVNRLGDEAFRLFLKGKYSMVVDHHSASADFAKVTLREETAASTTQILYKLYREYDESVLDDDIATMLFTGLLTDSGSFSFDSTTSETHEVASNLMKYTFDAAEINRIVIKDVLLNVFHLRNRVLSKTQIYKNGAMGVIVFREEDFKATQTTEKDTDGIVNSVINIDGVELAVSISEIADKQFKVSFRSKHNVDASACAKCFGGGGHFHAAGCRVYGYFEDVYNKILDASKEIMSYA